MQNLNYISAFKNLTLPQKFHFFEGTNNSNLESSSDKTLNVFLKEIILDNQENDNIRKNALETYVQYTVINRIKVRQALSLLIDEWNDNADVFLKLQRLKDLYLFYNEEKIEIENIYQNILKEETETELLSESLFNLGLINMQKGFSSMEKEKTLIFLEKSKFFFIQSNEVVENRIDSKFYEISITIIVDLMNGIKIIEDSNLKHLSSILFQKNAYSFNHNLNSFHLGFYRVLNTLNIIKQETPNSWLNFRKNLSELYSKYSEFTNSLLKERLNKSLISKEFKNIVKTRFIEPYFTLSFQAQLSKIDSRLTELESTNPEFDFLNEIRDLVINKKNKKKVESEILKNTLIKVFPNRSLSNIEESISKIDESNPFDYLSAFEELKMPSTKEYIDKLISACIELQGNRLFKGNFSEDDRNTFITSLLRTNYEVNDQKRWSKSAAGKSAGEIDIFVFDSKGFPYSIIEALNLDSIKSDYIILHLDKIFNYDTSGLANNFILVYSNSKNFDLFWKRYVKFISKHTYQYEFKSFQENKTYPFTDIKIGAATHIRNGKSIKLFHLMIDLSDK